MLNCVEFVHFKFIYDWYKFMKIHCQNLTFKIVSILMYFVFWNMIEKKIAIFILSKPENKASLDVYSELHPF